MKSAEMTLEELKETRLTILQAMPRLSEPESRRFLESTIGEPIIDSEWRILWYAIGGV